MFLAFINRNSIYYYFGLCKEVECNKPGPEVTIFIHSQKELKVLQVKPYLILLSLVFSLWKFTIPNFSLHIYPSDFFSNSIYSISL